MSRGTPVTLLVAVVSGGLVAYQQRVNGQLAVSLHDALLAAVVSFLTGLVGLIGLLAVRRSARARLGGLAGLPWWWRLGGLGGASLVAAGATAAPRIGVALFTVGLVAGTTIGGLLVDLVGLGPSGTHRVTAARLAGAALCLVAIAVSASRGLTLANPFLLAGVVVAGALVPFQQAVNGRVRAVTDATVATLQNFVVGLCGLLVVSLVVGVRADVWPGPDRWWLYLGGPLGAVFVAIAAVIVRRLGVLRLGLAVTAGQLAGGIALDVGHGLAVTTVVGAVLAMAAVVISGAGPRAAVPV